MKLREFHFSVVPGSGTNQHAYLTDSIATYPANDTRLLALPHAYPRISQHEVISTTDYSGVSKYEYGNFRGSSFNAIENAYTSDPTMVICRHISGHEYQGYTQSNYEYISAGFAFAGTGPATVIGNGSPGSGIIYAGHWLYEPGTRLAQSISNVATTIPVVDATRFTVGEYVCIYDAPAGSFINAEHAEVTGKNTTSSPQTITIRGMREDASNPEGYGTTPGGYKSTRYAHDANAIVAQHVLGQGAGLSQGGDGRLWVCNFSSQCPRDANNKQWNAVYAEWLATHYNVYKNNITTSARIVGIHLDTDFYFDLGAMNSDCNNDLVLDNGRNGSTNWAGQGMDEFYRLCRLNMGDKHLVAGVHDSRGFAHYNGCQNENAWDYGNGDFNYPPKYEQLNSMWAMYLYNCHARAYGPVLVQCLTKNPTRQFPTDAYPVKDYPSAWYDMDAQGNPATKPMDNRSFRLGLALTLMDCGYYGTHSNYTPDGWWDEYAVDLTVGSPTYGQAVPRSPLATARAKRGWLGQPLGVFQRVYDYTAFAAGNSLPVNGTFETGITGWTGEGVTVQRDDAQKMDGTASLKVNAMTVYQAQLAGARARAPGVSLTQYQEYTVCFAARASIVREISVSFGSMTSQRVYVDTTWRRYVMTFKHMNAGGTFRANFEVGKETSDVWLDSVYVFAGNANVFRRDFTNGIALANATPSQRTISLGGTFRRIKGTQERTINNGQLVTSVTLEPFDGLLLIRA